MNYSERRKNLRKLIPYGDIILFSAKNVPRNYPAELYPFHQDATFRYFTGLNIPDAALVIDTNGREKLFIKAPDPDDVIWTGPVPSIRDYADMANIEFACDYKQLLGEYETHAHWLNPYDFQLKIELSRITGNRIAQLEELASKELINAIVKLRSCKDVEEVAEIEEAISVTREMLVNAQDAIKLGHRESDVLAALMAPAIAKQRDQAFNPIVTTHGETLHNTGYGHVIEQNDMIVIDCGAESVNGYCADITRTFAASGSFSSQKKALYEAVLSAQKAGIAQTECVATTQFDVHMAACRALTLALQDIGLMRGNVDDSLEAGAHALFMPHGIGHMLGLDAHDMENLGDAVGYAPGTQRSTQFGLNALRLARRLEPGFVLTVEPGCYFIPELIDRWKAENKLSEFICYDEVEKFRDCRGIRIEDDVLITETGSRVLGPGIDK